MLKHALRQLEELAHHREEVAGVDHARVDVEELILAAELAEQGACQLGEHAVR